MEQFKFEEHKFNFEKERENFEVERAKFEFKRRKKLNKMRTLVCKKNKRGRIYKRKVNYNLFSKLRRAIVEMGIAVLVTARLNGKETISMREINEKLREKIELDKENRRIKKEERRMKND